MKKNNISSYIKSIVRDFLAADSWALETTAAPSYYVAAGNPRQRNSCTGDKNRPQELMDFAKGNTGFVVSGKSMAPLGILDGYAIVGKEINGTDIKQHRFIIIKVDKELDSESGKKVMFDYKLRYTLGNIEPEVDFESFYNEISQHEDMIIRPNAKEEIKEKYRKAIRNYGTETPFVLSLTYKEGRSHFSVHPASLVEYEVIRIGQQDGVNWQEVPMHVA